MIDPLDNERNLRYDDCHGIFEKETMVYFSVITTKMHDSWYFKIGLHNATLSLSKIPLAEQFPDHVVPCHDSDTPHDVFKLGRYKRFKTHPTKVCQYGHKYVELPRDIHFRSKGLPKQLSSNSKATSHTKWR